MLKDRGYIVPDYYEPKSVEEFKENFDNRQKMMLKVNKEMEEENNNNENDDSLVIIFPEEDKLSVVEIERYARVMLEKSVSRAILILKSEITKRAT